MTIASAESSISVCIALVKLHSAIAIIIQPNAAPPGTPRRVRAMTAAAQIDSAVDATARPPARWLARTREPHYQPNATPLTHRSLENDGLMRLRWDGRRGFLVDSKVL